MNTLSGFIVLFIGVAGVALGYSWRKNQEKEKSERKEGKGGIK